MDKVVVTGGAGFIGRHLVRELQNSGASVAVVDDGRCGRLDLLHADIEVVNRDISTMAAREWAPILQGTSTIFHLAAAKLHTPNADADTLISTNVSGTYRLAEAAAQMGNIRFVFASSLYAHGGLGPQAMNENGVPRPSTLYGATKLMGEGILRSFEKSHGLSWGGARLFFTYGSGQFADGGYPSVIVRNFERMRDGKAPVIFGSGRQSLDYIHVSDVVSALRVLVADAAVGRVVNVCRGIAIPVLDLVKQMLLIAQKDGAIEFREADWTEGTVRVGVVSQALKSLGWAPTVSLDEGLRECWTNDFVQAL